MKSLRAQAGAIDECIDPLAMIYFTDLYNDDKPKEPHYPLMRIAPAHSLRNAPFEKRGAAAVTKALQKFVAAVLAKKG